MSKDGDSSGIGMHCQQSVELTNKFSSTSRCNKYFSRNSNSNYSEKNKEFFLDSINNEIPTETFRNDGNVTTS